MVTNKITAIGLLTGLLTISLGHGIALADIPGNHPYYLHARSDLRKSESLLETSDEFNVTQETKTADRYLHNAIQDVEVASNLDGKNINNYPPIDTSLQHRDKFQAIYQLLNSANQDISREEDNNFVLSWRNKAEFDINQAKHFTAIAAARDAVDDLSGY
ncbi:MULTISPECIES: hypothetical protein [Nostoc]|uniref:Uncharacterized protein n=1 Tax=Nostoc paludosum FACHB-159 TaxID=2692908 RepID=A0ABR8KIB1_9NOSO|nr:MULTISPECIES: hypothetical protein [Nostoc]MBD2681308.1 hypothetical protein [Nostoc sp. FACHB-857]MBD2737787.1 hypothetical protein [Nostoc paludosum FACHB-159]